MQVKALYAGDEDPTSEDGRLRVGLKLLYITPIMECHHLAFTFFHPYLRILLK